MARSVRNVTLAGWYAQLDDDHLPPAVSGLVCQLQQQLRALESAALSLDYLHFNEATLQRYEPGSGRVSPQRDQMRHRGLLAVFTLIGTARFAILSKPEPDAVIEEWITTPGDLVLLRGSS